MIHPDYRCKECDGRGSVNCKCCGSQLACKACDMSGLSAEAIDVDRFYKAKGSMRAHFGYVGWAAVDNEADGYQTGLHFGKVGGEAMVTLYFRDFLKGGAK